MGDQHEPGRGPVNQQAEEPGEQATAVQVPAAPTMLGAVAQQVGPGRLQRKLQRRALDRQRRPGAAGETVAGAPVQRRADEALGLGSESVHDIAQQGLQGAAQPLPHHDAIQRAFGEHDLGGVRAHVGGSAATAATALGAAAYATGEDVAFGQTPDLHTAAHEAAHVVQQRGGVQLAGGVGEVGDAHERQADAVADRVVQGLPASDLLGGAGASAGGPGGIQGKALQLDVKADLRDAMKGWFSSGEDKIFARIQRATPAEIQAVVEDTKLMEELRKDLSQSAMEKLCDQVDAPLPYKLRLALRSGSGINYLIRSIDHASAKEVQDILADKGLVEQLLKDLGRDSAMLAMQRLHAPLKDKLRAAMKGWGRNEDFMFSSLTAAPLAEVSQLAQDRAMQGEIDDEMSTGDANRFRAQAAHRIFQEGGAGQAEWAFFMLQGLAVDDKRLGQRLSLYGSLAEQRLLCDAVVTSFTDRDRVRQAFKMYWGVEMSAQDGATMQQWPIPVLKEMHLQLKRLPSQDTRAGVWKQLSLSNQSLIDPTSGNDVGLKNRAAYGDGNFIVGTNAQAGGTSSVYGISTPLTADAAASAPSLEVAEGPRLRQDEAITVGVGALQSKTKVKGIAGNTVSIDPVLDRRHVAGESVQPDDVTADKGGSWLSATVRHEIAHAVDAGLRGTVSQFQSNLGGWWTGTDINTWLGAMASPWKRADGTDVPAADQKKIKDAIESAAKAPKGSLFTKYGLAADHPLMQNQGRGVPAIDAAEVCLSNGDQFFAQGPALHRDNGKVFTVSFWYKQFMYCNEVVLNDRENDYTLYAPTEFFAETYTTFYEEAGQPGITDEMLGRRVRNSQWRDWIRTNIHNRGQAPAGTGPKGGATPGSGTGKKANFPGP